MRKSPVLFTATVLWLVLPLAAEAQQNGATANAAVSLNEAPVVQRNQALRNGHAFIGVAFAGGPSGLQIAYLLKDGPAEQGGIQAGDVVVRMKGKKVKTTADAQRIIRDLSPGSPINVDYEQGGKKFTVTLTTQDELALCLGLATKGDASAEFYLANIFLAGDGVQRDEMTGAEWLQKSALQGYQPAQEQLIAYPRLATDAIAADLRRSIGAWQAGGSKVQLPDEADRHRVLAEDAFQEKNLQKAAREYEASLELYPTWPQGQFNLALIEGELQDYSDAVAQMKNYLELVPDAPNAQKAKEQVWIWQDKLQSAQQAATPPQVKSRKK